jgi:acetyl esterase/lipase
MNPILRHTSFLVVLASASLAAQQPAPRPTTASEAPTRDTSYIDANGTAHITRVIPVPATVSPQAQQKLSRSAPDQGPPETLALRRSKLDASALRDAAAWSKLCPNHIIEDKIAGVPVRIVTPQGLLEANRDKVLLNLHGGGFNADSGSYAESIPIAGYTKMKVVAVLYRLAPEHPFPAAVDDAVAVYKELLKTYKPAHIVIYGTSAGAVLTAEVAVKLKQLGLPLPAALGIFSGMGDLSQNGDSISVFSVGGFTGHLSPPAPGLRDHEYIGNANAKDPVLSPVYSNLHGLPPSLLISSERDMLLSGTANLHRALLRAGVDARLVVFDALPHAFWYDAQLPESLEANHIMADFMVRELAGK